MLKRALVGFFLIAGISWAATGCSTAPRRHEVRPEVPLVQAPEPVVQTGPSAEEVEKLRKQNEEQQAALAKAEADKRALEDQLNEALSTKKHVTKKNQDTYLK